MAARTPVEYVYVKSSAGLSAHSRASSRNAGRVHMAASVLKEKGSKKMMSGGGALNLVPAKSPGSSSHSIVSALLVQRLSRSNARGAAWRRCLNHLI